MGDVDHMVGIHNPERSEAITNDGEEGDQDVIDDIDHVVLLRANGNPADKEQNPGQTEQGDQGSVKRDEEPERSADVTAKGFHTPLEFGPARVQHVANVVVQPINIFLTPALEGSAMRKDCIVGVLQVGCDAECTPRSWSLPLFLCLILFGNILERVGVTVSCGCWGE